MELHREPYPLEDKVRAFFARDLRGLPFEPTGLTRDYYLDMAEPIARRTAGWQDERGAINDPFEGREKEHMGAIFTNALSTLISAGRCRELLDKCLLAMDASCHDLYQKKVADQHLDFCTKNLVHALRNLRSVASPQDVARWQRWLGGFDPEKTYRDVEGPAKPAASVHNWNLFAVTGEWLKIRDGLADNRDFVEKYLSHQLKYFTSYGMYKDPNDPIAYDMASRRNVNMMLSNGYDGQYLQVLTEMTRRGDLTMLFMQSSTGQTPYGGRSNQVHWNEGCFINICEFEATRHKRLGDLRIAGAFKRAARLAALSLRRWLVKSDEYFILKNHFPPSSRHGYDGYAFYSHYGFGVANFLAYSYLYADDEIEETPAPCEVGGHVVELPDDFHKVFATAGGLHLEIDTRGDFSHDPTGLGRIHRKGIPGELGLSMGIVKRPHYSVSVPPSGINLAIGPAWEDRWGEWHRLAEYSSELEQTRVEVLEETLGTVHFRVRYAGALPGASSITEEYLLRGDVVEIRDEVRGAARATRMYFPLLLTNGSDRATIECRGDGFVVRLGGCAYSIKSKEPDAVTARILDVEAPNRNGIYKVGLLEKKGGSIGCEIRLTQVAPAE